MVSINNLADDIRDVIVEYQVSIHVKRTFTRGLNYIQLDSSRSRMQSTNRTAS